MEEKVKDEENVKNDFDLLSELSAMTSITKTIELNKKKEKEKKMDMGFESSQQMNDYIQQRIEEALKNKNLSSDDTPIVVKNGVKDDYANPRKASATGKHAGVSSFVQNFGTRGYGEERSVKPTGWHELNKQSSSKNRVENTDSKIADSILKKLKEREKKNKKKKVNSPEFRFTRLNAINTNGKSESEGSIPSQTPLGTPIQQPAPVPIQQTVPVPIQQTARGAQAPRPRLAPHVAAQHPINVNSSRREVAMPKRNFGYNFTTKRIGPLVSNAKVAGGSNEKMLAVQEQRLIKMQQQLSQQLQEQQFQQQQFQQQQRQFQQQQQQFQQQQFHQQPQQQLQPPPRQPQVHLSTEHVHPKKEMSNKKETSFVFILPAYDTGHLISKVFDSIKSQTYTNYRIIYINDCSNDNTIQEIEKYKYENPNMNITLINNATRQWPAYSRYIACKETNDNDVCVFLDGDDWLVTDDCLTTLNQVYKNSKIHATFGSMINANWQYKKWKKYKRNDIVNNGCYFPHLRTTRAAIVKAISPYYMQTETNDWLHVCTDIALFIAVTEAVGDNGYVFLKNEFVHYNTKNHTNNTLEGYNNTKDSDMRLYYKNNIVNKVPMKKIV